MSSSLEELKHLLDLNVLGTRGDVKLATDDVDWGQCRQVWVEDDDGPGHWSDVKAHVKIGVRALLANPWFMLADEMGGMKSAQVIIAAQLLYQAGIINRVIVLTPPSVRDVWYDQDLGELSLHLFTQGIASRVSEFHSKIRQWDWGEWSTSPDQLRWIITNYEFVARSKPRLKLLFPYCGPKTLLVIDESSAVANKTSLQSKACLELRRKCGRVVLLNGTPIVDSPLSLMNQANLMHPSILECPYITQFRDRYCVMNPNVDYPEITAWKNLEDLQRRLAPYVLRRLKDDCLDLPPKLPPVTITVPLTPTTWKSYKSMKKDMVAWVAANQASLAGHAMIKAMRLAQMTSGFIGGVEEIYEETDDVMPAFMQDEDWFMREPDVVVKRERQVFRTVQEIGREKLDAVLDFIAEHLQEDPSFKLLVWCSFRPELERLIEAVEKRFPQMRVGAIRGGQKKTERSMALRLLHPRTAIKDEPALLAGIYGAGSMGHNFTAASVVLNMSHTYSLFKHKQSMDRVHRPGQRRAVSYFDLVATGPDGQKTIDHSILKVRKNKDDVATWTAKAWLDVLQADAA